MNSSTKPREVYILFVTRVFCQSHASCIWAKEHSEFRAWKFHFSSHFKSMLKVFSSTQNSSWSSWSSSGLKSAASSWRKAFCVYCFLTTASFLHRRGKGKGFFGKIQKSSFWAQIQWNKRRRTCSTQIEHGQAQSRRRTPMEEGKRMFEGNFCFACNCSVFSKKFTIVVLSRRFMFKKQRQTQI